METAGGVQGLEGSSTTSTEAFMASKRRKDGNRGDLAARAVHALMVATCAIMFPAMLLCLVASIVNADEPAASGIIVDLIAYGLQTFLAMPGALWLVATSTGATWHLRLAVVYSMLNWVLRLLFWLEQLLRADLHIVDFSAVGDMVMTSLIVVLISMIAIGAELSILRLKVLERSCLEDFHAKQAQRAFWTVCFIASILAAAEGAVRFYEGFRVFQLVLLAVAFPTVLGAVCLFLHGIWRALRLAGEACENAPEGRTAQALSMHQALRRELLCITLMALTSLVLVVLWAMVLGIIPFTFSHIERVTLALGLLDTVSNEWFALSLSGAASGAMRGSATRAAAAKERKRRWRAAHAQWSGRWQESRAEELQQWDEKVCELAGRGISLEALLRFYRDLPGLMRSYDPRRHTTNDVVRGAIIPFSAPQRSACSSVLMGGKFTLPHKMVTHNWSNLFVDLLAAIVADALGENDFSMTSELLRSDLARLEKWVGHANVGGKTYWVCAFSVNQHVGICGTVLPNAKDTVTGLRPTPCHCGREKAWNDTAPLLPDGRGVACEMNKFDDMMKFLAAADPAFGQVVAVDAQFLLFSRAWCVAEIATASWAGMVQGLVIHSKEAMSRRVEQLRSLRIQDMEASRPEDKEEILASIADLEAFNANLQRLLFEELFPAWSSLDAEERMASGGAVIRWLPVWAAAAEEHTVQV